MDAHPKVVKLAEALPQEAWKPLERLARYEIATEPRRKPQRIKEAIVRSGRPCAIIQKIAMARAQVPRVAFDMRLFWD
jgi:ribosomal protein S14